MQSRTGRRNKMFWKKKPKPEIKHELPKVRSWITEVTVYGGTQGLIVFKKQFGMGIKAIITDGNLEILDTQLYCWSEWIPDSNPFGSGMPTQVPTIEENTKVRAAFAKGEWTNYECTYEQLDTGPGEVTTP